MDWFVQFLLLLIVALVVFSRYRRHRPTHGERNRSTLHRHNPMHAHFGYEEAVGTPWVLAARLAAGRLNCVAKQHGMIAR